MDLNIEKGKGNYKSIAKGNALFGGVQLYNILISIFRSKVVAIILGPEGMGIMGLLNSSVDLVKSATNFGLQTSAVRDISLANNTNDIDKIENVHAVVSKIVWFTGFLGLLVCLVFAKHLSIWSFGNEEYTNELRILSVVLLVSQLTVSNQVLLQGLRKLRYLAKSNIIGNTLGFILVIPLYYYLGNNGIAPSIIITATVGYLVSLYYYRKLKLNKRNITLKQAFIQGKDMISLGFMLSFTGIMDVLVTYLIKILISNMGGVSEVGLYNAGFAIVLGYVGLIFSSIGTDYYPRLVSVINDEEKYNDVINEQMEIMVLALLPLVSFFITLSPVVIRILYSEQFLGICSMVNIMAVGMILRAISWCPGFMYIAKGDSKLYLVIYIITIVVTLLVYYLCYYQLGLTGIGVAFTMLYLIGLPSTFLITKHYYNYRLRNLTKRINYIALSLTGGILFCSFMEGIFSWIGMGVLTFISCIYSAKELNKRLDLCQFVKQRVLRK